MPSARRRAVMKRVRMTGRNKKIAVAAVIVIIAAIALATNSYVYEGCILGNYAYAGQAVDAEQAIAKLKAFTGNIDRTSFTDKPAAAASLDFSKASVEHVDGTVKASYDKTKITLDGWVLSVSGRAGGSESFYLSDADGNLYQLKDSRCV